MTAASLLAALRARGFTLTATGDRLSVRPAKLLSDDDREAINQHLPALVAALAAESPPQLSESDSWNTPAAVRLMHAADTAVERHGCRGADPAIQAAAGRAAEAYQRRDLAGLTRACDEVAGLARGIQEAA